MKVFLYCSNFIREEPGGYYNNKIMNRKKVVFDFVKCKPIEFTECELGGSELLKNGIRERSQSSIPYEEIRKRELLRGPIQKYDRVAGSNQR